MTPELTLTLTQANEYFSNRLYSDYWDNIEESDKIKALYWASKIIEGAFAFSSDAYTQEEDGVFIWNNRILDAVCEEAVWILQADPTSIPTDLLRGIRSASAGNSTVTFDKSLIRPFVCKASEILIGNLGSLNDSGGSIHSTMMKY